MNRNDYNGPTGTVITLLLLSASGIILILYAAFYSEITGALLWVINKRINIIYYSEEKIRALQLYLLLTGLGLIIFSALAGRIKWLKTFLAGKIVTNILLFTLSLSIPITVMELSTGPIVDHVRKTTIFARDPELGWKLRAGAEDFWGGVRVKINGKGLRGPELDYEKPAGTKRVLFLGDSVCFGFRLEDYRHTYPSIIENLLEDRVQSINAGVGGYATWQEYVQLSTEGIKYNPDLVILSFILNDVDENSRVYTPKKAIKKSYQLSQTHFSPSMFDRLLNRSGVVYFIKTLYAGARFGQDIQKGAKREESDNVRLLINNQDIKEVNDGWKVTLEYIGKISDFCRKKDIQLILVVFPFTFQFRDIEVLNTPQAILNKYAVDNKIPIIDLLPMLRQKMEATGLGVRDYFIDSDHLSPLGNEVVSDILVDFIQREKVLQGRNI